jgi:GTP-binding protein YchF
LKDVGLVGLPHSGKSTLFTALTRTGAAGGRSNQAVVEVPDPRVETLGALERSRKLVHAQIRFVDVPGGTTGRGLATLREMDALCMVLRAFGPDAEPVRALAEVTAELILADLVVVESALDGARRRAKSGRTAAPEIDALERAHAALSEERRLADAGLTDEEAAHLRSIGPLTLKPWLPIAALEEGADLPTGLPEETIGVFSEIEAEVAEMPEDEGRTLLAEFGDPEPGLPRVISAGYRALGLVTFLTANENEAHAWQLRAGATAREAAGVVHADMHRGFIRTEVVPYEDIVAAGGWHGVHAKGLMRVEGKDYVVKEGDVLHIRFSV